MYIVIGRDEHDGDQDEHMSSLLEQLFLRVNILISVKNIALMRTRIRM